MVVDLAVIAVAIGVASGILTLIHPVFRMTSRMAVAERDINSLMRRIDKLESSHYETSREERNDN
jgi:hypothetical protein